MKTYVYSGQIMLGRYPWEDILLIQPDGELISIGCRFSEIRESNRLRDGREALYGVTYYITDTIRPKQDIQEHLIKSLCGSIDIDLDRDVIGWSSWTFESAYDVRLVVGGHDLYNELKESEGMYLLIEISVK